MIQYKPSVIVSPLTGDIQERLTVRLARRENKRPGNRRGSRRLLRKRGFFALHGLFLLMEINQWLYDSIL